MREDITCQKLWTKVVRAMTYGSHRIIPWSIADRAWPATGQNEVVQLALVVGGHAPEVVRSTVERVRLEFADDPSFVITEDPRYGDIHVERLETYCPYCQGHGLVYIDGRLAQARGDMPNDATWYEVKCGHEPIAAPQRHIR
ncbi:MAG: hypothetical protein ACR2PM_17265 [Hyphomicrobiales bacterium]